jgi:serine/threonine-protein kinase
MTERFTLISELGRGGMGVVWKARDRETGQIVALKLLRETYAEDPDYVTRFERELELARRIDSAHVVKVLGFGVRKTVPYLALEYIDGPSLHDALTAHGPYSWPETRAILAQLAQGLADANAAGVIHRDVKPSNVLIAPDGTAKLTDFGIARGLDLTRFTATSTILGTPAYLAPEGPKDARSDLYSLGVIGYELLTGAVPFKGTSYQEVIVEHIRTAPDLEKLPPDARPIIGWLLAKNPDDRPQRASVLLAALGGSQTAPALAMAGAGPAFAASGPTSIIRPPTGRHTSGASLFRPPLVRSRRAILLVAGFVALALAFASGVTLPTVLPGRGSPSASGLVSNVGGRGATEWVTPGLATETPAISVGPSGIAESTSSIGPKTAASAPATIAPALAPGSVATPTNRSGAAPTPIAAAAPTPTATPTPTIAPTPTAATTPTPSQTGAFISGVVTASDGSPLAGILVWAVGVKSGLSAPSTISRADGSYTMGPVIPGRYTAWFEDYESRRYAMVAWTSAGADINGASALAQFDVSNSSMSGIDVAMPLGYRVSGTLTPSPGQSLPSEASVFLCRVSDGACPNSLPMASDGTYSTYPVPAGVYRAAVWATYGSSQKEAWWSSSGQWTTDMKSATPITITSSAITGIDGQLPW